MRKTNELYVFGERNFPPRKFPALCSSPVFPPQFFPPGIPPPWEICRWQKPVSTRVLNPNASEATYKPEQRRVRSVPQGVKNPRGGETSGREKTGENHRGGNFRGGKALAPYIYTSITHHTYMMYIYTYIHIWIHDESYSRVVYMILFTNCEQKNTVFCLLRSKLCL